MEPGAARGGCLRIAVGSRSDVGLIRTNNEDHYAVELPVNLFVLCDGMGGQAAGEVASRMGVESIIEHCRHQHKNSRTDIFGEYREEFTPLTNRLASAVRISNEVIYGHAMKDASTAGMGATVVAGQIRENILSIAHVGDSRIYLFRGRQLQQLTQDHSLVMEQVRQGLMSVEQAEESDLANVILRALGAEPTVQVDLDELWIGAGDQLLFCSDGLTRMVTEQQISAVLAQITNPQQAADKLVELANDKGGEDNTTVIVVRMMPSPSSGWRKWLGLEKQ
ncbi:MAG: Stp1/IreP family PP2C-type Ser/Thr phosphatase [Acidobacteria bacterium]|nr:Stp1/IreP family PP2C-type Ser/Thr phosphatase [Acidobacteriota bacterium]